MTPDPASAAGAAGDSRTIPLPAELIDRLAKHEFALADFGWSQVGTIEGRHSQVFRFRVGSSRGDAAVLVKRITRSRSPEVARETVIREFTALETVGHRLPATLRATVPVPYAVLPDSCVLVVEHMAGDMLRRVMYRQANRLAGPWFRRRLIRTAGEVGRWLRAFHEATAGPPGIFDCGTFRAEIERNLSRCTELALGPAADAILRWASAAADLYDGQAVPVAARHGDFIPQNILVHAHGVAVVDFENFAERDAIYEDLATFTTYLAILSRRAWCSGGTVRAMLAGFNAAYGARADDRILRLYQLKAATDYAAQFRFARGVKGWLNRAATLRTHLLQYAQGFERTGPADAGA